MSEPKSKSRGGDFTYLGKPYPAPPNGAIEPHSTILPFTPTSAGQAEHGQLFELAKDIVAQRQLLDWIGYPQTAPTGTEIYEDNQATFDITHKAVKQRRSKHWAMRAHYTQELQQLGIINVIKIDGTDQLADYYTKNNPPKLHSERTPKFVQYTATTETSDNSAEKILQNG
jgi:hypothetical protein